MGRPSSISSSELSRPPRGFPLAVLVAVLVLGAVEVGFRLLPPAARIGYGRGIASYYDVRHAIEDLGAAEVAVIGSSRGNEALVMPELRRLLPGRAANYSCPDATAEDMLPMVDLLLKAERPPAVILLPMSPRELHGTASQPMRAEALGVRAPSRPAGLGEPLAAAAWRLREWLLANYLTFRHRERATYVATSLLRGRAPTSPIKGELSVWQRYTPDRSLATRPVSEPRVRQYVAMLLDEQGRYPLGRTRIEALVEMGRRCRAAGVPLVTVEIPLPAILRAHYPPGLMDEFHAVMSEASLAGGFPFVRTEELGLELGPEHFREQSHLNLAGARLFTAAVAGWLRQPRVGPAAIPLRNSTAGATSS